MDFSDPTNKNGLVQHCEQALFGDNGFGKISGNSNLLAIFANNANQALDWYAGIAMKNDGRWRYDDSNNTTLMEAYTNLVADQEDYTLDVSFLTVSYVEALDPTGTVWTPLSPISIDEIKATGWAIGEYGKNAAVPSQYRKDGSSIFLLPPSSYDMDGGLKIGIQRGVSYFAATDTTKQAGMPPGHARFIYDYMSWLYARDRDMKKAVQFEKRVIQYEQVDIPDHYGKRSRDEQKVVRPVYKKVR